MKFMKKPGKYLKFYYKCMESGKMPNKTIDDNSGGLCGNFGNSVMDLFIPTDKDCVEYDVRTWSYFAHDPGYSFTSGFSPTRQNIVLFLAAMKGELNGKEKT